MCVPLCAALIKHHCGVSLDSDPRAALYLPMASPNYSFEKRKRENDKKARKAERKARKAEEQAANPNKAEHGADEAGADADKTGDGATGSV